MILSWWSPLGEVALLPAAFPGLALFLLLHYLAKYALRAGATWVKVQLTLLNCVWPLWSLGLCWAARFTWPYKPARGFLEFIPKPGTGSLWFVGFPPVYRLDRFILWGIDCLLGAWFLVLCLVLRARLAKAARHAEISRLLAISAQTRIVSPMT